MADNNLTTSKESTVKDFLEVIFRRKWVIIGVVVFATVVVLFLNMREAAVYESAGRVLVKRGEASGAFSSHVRTLTWEEEMASQLELIRSEIVVGRARENISGYLPEGYETAERIYVGNVAASVVGTSNVIWVGYTSSDPVFTKAAADAVLTAYKEHYTVVRTPPEMEDFFSREMTELAIRIDELRKKKARLRSQWGILDLQTQQRGALNRIEGFRTELDDIRAEIAEKEENGKKLDEFRELDIDEQAALSNTLQQEGAKQTVIERYTERLMELRLEESALAVKYTDSHRDLIKVRKQIEDLYFYLEKEARLG